MQVGLFVDLRNPSRWRRPWSSFYASRLDQLAAAEELGIESVWLTEHHLFDDGYLSQPLTFAAAVAARTTRMRIGTAVLIAPLRSAIDVAEQAAVVDLVSAGRLELGLGAGYRVPEFDAFGVPISERYRLLEQRAEAIKRLWEHGGFTPAPIQEKAPLWIGAHGPRGARLAGRLGAGLLSFSRATEVDTAYLDALARAGHDRSVARRAGCANLIISSDPEAAWPRIAPHLAYQWGSYARYNSEGAARRPGSGATVLGAIGHDVDAEALRSQGPDMTQPNFDVVTADEAVRRIGEWLRGLPVHTVYFWDSIAGMPDDLSEEHVRLLGEQVKPRLRDHAALSPGPTPIPQA